MTNSKSSAAPLPCLPPRAADSHKGDFGTALIVGGSRGMSGAVALAGMAALRSGAGRVRLAVPDACLETVAAFEPSYMTSPLACDEEGRISVAAYDALRELADSSTAVACGPGLGRSQHLVELVSWMYEALPQPLVIDADALNGLAAASTIRSPGGPRILTPHPGEFRRFLADGPRTREVLEEVARQKARDWNAVVVLKGHRTLITDGRDSFHNETGNPGMATGGTGDVLTGVVTALLCQGLAALEAARLGAYLHGLAGDLAAGSMGQISLTATDLVRFLPAAFQQFVAAAAQ